MPALPETIQAYIQAVEGQIRWRRARGVVSLELRRHLEDQRDAFAAEGREDAERLAVEEMGDPVSVGTELDRLHRPRPQWGLLGLTIVLACAGAFLRVWLTMGLPYGAVSPVRTVQALALGIVALLGAYFLDVSFLARHPGAIYLGALALGILMFQISPYCNNGYYLVRHCVPSYPAVYAVWLYGCRGARWRDFLLAVAGGIPLAVMDVLAPSSGGLLILLVSGLILLLCAVQRGWFGPEKRRRTGAALALAACLPVLALGRNWRQAFSMRLRLLLHPELEPLGRGYYSCILREHLRDVPLLRDMSAAPAAGTDPNDLIRDQDFLLAKMALEWGWLVSILLLAAITALLIWLLVRCLKQRQELGRLIALAVVLSLGLEALLSTALNLGFILFYAHLPLVMGNLHTVVDMALIGLALSVFRGGGVLRDEPAGEARRPVFPWRVKISIVSANSTKET